LLRRTISAQLKNSEVVMTVVRRSTRFALPTITRPRRIRMKPVKLATALATALLLSLPMSAFAQEAEEEESAFSGTLAVTSDYVFRSAAYCRPTTSLPSRGA